MKAATLLRVASVLLLLNTVGHTINVLFGRAAPGIQESTEAAMKNNHFVALGVTRTYWDYFLGYGLSISVYLILQTIVCWQLASMAGSGRLIGPIVLTLAVTCVGASVLAWRYFFWGPALFQGLVALCLLAAWISLNAKPRI